VPDLTQSPSINTMIAYKVYQKEESKDKYRDVHPAGNGWNCLPDVRLPRFKSGSPIQSQFPLEINSGGNYG
jgi:hypothetical protein